MLRIENVNIKGVGGIINLDLPLKKGVNIICGPNGIGKTTILECISKSFTPFAIKTLKKNASVDEGLVKVTINQNNSKRDISYRVREFNPLKNDFGRGDANLYSYIMDFKIYREIHYQEVKSIKRDRVSNNAELANRQNDTGIVADDIKDWFINRYLWETRKGALDNNQKHNFELAKKCFSMVDSNVKFSKVTPDTFDIIVNTNEGDIYYEYLSSGYKSILYMLLGIIKEVEFRFKEPKIKVEDFDGILLIDEIDLHLHPRWQAQIYEAIKKLLPNAQIIMTTHSPHIIQAAQGEEVISLRKCEDGSVGINDLPTMEYGFQGWTVEEILQDVMGLENVKSALYNSMITNFNRALDEDNYESAIECYNILKKMLHPQNSLLKLLRIQMAGMDK